MTLINRPAIRQKTTPANGGKFRVKGMIAKIGKRTPGSRLLTDAKGRHGLSADARPKASMAASAR